MPSMLLLVLATGCATDDAGEASSEAGGSGALAGGGAGAESPDDASSGGSGSPSVGGASAGEGGAGEGGTGEDEGGAGEGGAGEGGAGEGAAAACEDPGTFSGPQLRDCDLPGACGRCMWEKACASFLFRCAKNADCVCMAECVSSAGVNGVEACFDQCGLTESPPGFAEWVKGASDMCWDEGCGTLSEPIADPTSTTGGNTGAGSEADCAFDPSLVHDPCGAVLQLQSADGSLCARIERREEGPGDDANVRWTLLDARIGPLGQVCHVDDPADFCWFSSHHNYADWVHVSCGALHYDLNIGKDCGKLRRPDSTYRLHVSESEPAGDECAPTADGTCPVVAPIDLFPAQ